MRATWWAPWVFSIRESPSGASRARNGKPLIVIEVEPGEITKVAGVKLDFEGDIANSTDRGAITQRDEIRAGWRLPIGHPFTQDDWDRAKSHALRLLVARRYPAGRVSYSLADIDAPAGRAELGLRLDSGPLFRLGPMHVRGIERYDPNLVPRLARLPAGSLYDQDAITRAQLRLSGSGYYDSAFIFVDPEDDPGAAGVQVTVREAPLQKVVLGLGVSTDTGARASIEHRYNRVPGIDWRAVTKLQLETNSPFAETEWTAIPGEDGWRWGVLARIERLDDDDLVTDAQRLRWGRTWAGDHIDRNVYVQYDRATVEVAPGSTASVQDTGDGTSVSANFVWTGRYFDKTPFPSRGFGIGFELGGGLTLTGSKSPFQRTVVRWLGVQPLPQGRLQLRTEAGAVLAASDAQVPIDAAVSHRRRHDRARLRVPRYRRGASGRNDRAWPLHGDRQRRVAAAHPPRGRRNRLGERALRRRRCREQQCRRPAARLWRRCGRAMEKSPGSAAGRSGLRFQVQGRTVAHEHRGHLLSSLVVRGLKGLAILVVAVVALLVLLGSRAVVVGRNRRLGGMDSAAARPLSAGHGRRRARGVALRPAGQAAFVGS